MVKDRLPELQCFHKRSVSNTTKQIQENTTCAGDSKYATLVRLLQKIQELYNRVKTLETFVKNLEELQHEIEVSPVEQNKLKLKIIKTKENITCLSNKVRIQLRSIQSETEPTTIGERIKRLHYRTLLDLFFEIHHKYNMAEEVYQQRRKKIIQRQMAILGVRSLSESHLQNLLKKDNYICDVQCHIELEKEQLSDMENRCADIKNLEADICQINDMFFSVQHMIDHQGSVLDNIQQKVEYSQQPVEPDSQVLGYRKARTYVEKNLAKRVMMKIRRTVSQ